VSGPACPEESEPAGPLAGLRVLDASSIIAGPLCCQILADYGADVVKVEHPRDGDPVRGHGAVVDGTSLWWKVLGRNKRSVGIDLHTETGQDLFRELGARADVLVESFRPGVLERWGLGSERLRESNPGLVVLHVTGFGQTGPYAARAGYGTLAEAMSGFAHLTGRADEPPTLPAFGLADSICGIAGSSAVLMALRHRDLTGEGQDVDLSLLEPILAAMGPSPTVYDVLGTVDTRHGNRSLNNAPRNTYLTSDGRWVVVSASSLNVARRVLTLVGHPELTEEPWFSTSNGRVTHVDEIDDYVATWIAQRPAEEVVAAFTEAGAALAPVYTAADIVEDEHIRATEMLTTVDDPELGPVLMTNVMWRMARTPGRVRFPGRALGADTDDVLSTDLGHTPDEIAGWRRDGAVG
jgi:crotonobetainyl-CoA:carnitine CoA-transferase CaiB-like acyl-CoA transferase